MFNKILIANRGAIATRITRTLKRQGISSVAIYAECDVNSQHVQVADEAYSLGDGNAATTYLHIEKILSICKQCGAEAIHPGYGFLSENHEFVKHCEQAGIVFIGPTSDQIEIFGLKHKARELAEEAKIPLLSGSKLLTNLSTAKAKADEIGYPVMLKSTAGGGGIGMQRCADQNQLELYFESIRRTGTANYSNDGVFIEKFIENARHIEVQVFGDGQGNALSLGERDCSSQRRNQKVIEECPAPNLDESLRKTLSNLSEKLLANASYRSAGTVEFLVDADSSQFFFLEVNTRLQVEHGVTEEVFGVDLVEWMIRIAAGESLQNIKGDAPIEPDGHSIQARLYAEDPEREFRPCAGLLSHVEFPSGPDIRIDHWIESGVEVPSFFDPMLAKIIVKADTREKALEKLQYVLDKTSLYGSETNLQYLRALSKDKTLLDGLVTTRYLNDFLYCANQIEVLQGGTQTTIQDYPGRRGYWNVGVPPSGPFDSVSFRLGNKLLNNPDHASGLEITLQGPLLKFNKDTFFVVSGAEIELQLDGENVPLWQVIEAKKGQQLQFGSIKNSGVRSYLCIAGGIQSPSYLGSKSTFTLGQFGGHNGRSIRTGDILHLGDSSNTPLIKSLPAALIPPVQNHWTLRTIYGPHGAPDFLTEEDINTFYSAKWEVHYNSNRTGIRLIGPRPKWARTDGGEAGLHPSNIHDNAYAFGTVDFTGDMPVILGPDGPSLGGFVCPATVIQADLWKLGQLRASDTLQFQPVSLDDATSLERKQLEEIDSLSEQKDIQVSTVRQSPILDRIDKALFGDEIVFRAAGDHFLLIEYGEKILDIRLRFRAHALMQWLKENPIHGLLELTPGIRSLQVHYNSQQLNYRTLLKHLKHGEESLSTQLHKMSVPSRIVNIPLSWDDEACREAIEKYDQSVRKNAPWSPSNLEFIRRINGLEDINAVKNIVFNASYLVMGLGDVYLGAPVATPIDPRHRLVTTKYNPARTWTAENSVGIGGSYLCVYGMEGPGGYQFVGRTLQMWNKYHKTREFEQPWLLRFFDQIRFYEVTNQELTQIRKDFPHGRYPIKIEDSKFSLSRYQDFLTKHQQSIDEFKLSRESAYNEELNRWHSDGQFNYEPVDVDNKIEVETNWPDGSTVVESPVSGSIWQINTSNGQTIKQGESLIILESMKMEIEITAPCNGVITHLQAEAGGRVTTGQTLIVIEPDSKVKL